MEHSFILRPSGIAPCVVFTKVGDSLRPQTSEASQLLVINDLQKEKKVVNFIEGERKQVADMKAKCFFPSTGTKHPDSRAQPTQNEKKFRKLLKRYASLVK